ncbi:amidase [Cognatishimia sp.]|uniref:amidase n=1 Tax=Cognatishimia sp. TaxID=2211648 RepID=UPI0035117D52
MKTANQILANLRSGALSAVDLMAETYDQIARVNPKVNAITGLLDRDAALDLARQADQSDATGPLHGLPIAIKDLANAEGFVTTRGSPLFANDKPAPADDIMVARMRAAGALVIGKTNAPEFGLGSHTTNPVFGPTRNPWDLSRTAGGSSGGAAVALATGMLALADGSDMMGSLRNPAGWTNTYGLRPSFGAVPSEPHADSFLTQLATNGPMARTPEDLAMLLSVQAGDDPRQPHFTPLPKADSPKPLRIGWLADWDGAYQMEAGILDTCSEALAAFSALGHAVVPLSAGFSAEAIWESWITLRSWQVSTLLAPLEALPNGRTSLNRQAIWELDRGKAMSAHEVHKASVTRSQWYKQAAHLFEQVDVLALPTAQVWPFDVTLDWPQEIAGTALDTYHRWMEVVVPASLLGLPALAVPAGFGAAGLPIGLQLIGPRGSDFSLIQMAQPYHDAVDWTDRLPPAV